MTLGQISKKYCNKNWNHSQPCRSFQLIALVSTEKKFAQEKDRKVEKEDEEEK